MNWLDVHLSEPTEPMRGDIDYWYYSAELDYE
jgi:hypothetical protein